MSILRAAGACFSNKMYYNGRMAVIMDSLIDTIKDTVTLIPFLFITYLVMEWLEDKTEDQSPCFRV